ncbi:rhomboid protease GluP [Lachnospiraceae bacterium NE2001]|nr:rhomboid protease GluP [Lachnospiraceae bacterium NE2001]
MNYNQDKKGPDGLTIEDYKPIMTFILIGLNAIVFILETTSGGSENIDVLLKYGASYAPYIFEDGQWYRIFTCMFVHIGIEHIASNMICLIAVGQYVENYFGRVKYIVIYVLAGLVGSILSLMVDMSTGNFAVSAGASGAICGLIGTLIVLALDPETRRIFPMYRVIIAIILVMVPSKEGIDVAAHIGGLLGGLATGYTFYYFDKSKT